METYGQWNSRFIYLDTETTGSGPDDRLRQIAFETEVDTATRTVFNSGRPISIDSMAVRHTTNKMVEDKTRCAPTSKGPVWISGS